jgi:hypothetical protein
MHWAFLKATLKRLMSLSVSNSSTHMTSSKVLTMSAAILRGRWLAHGKTRLLPKFEPYLSPFATESAYKCGVQVCFTIVLLLVGLNKP